jgi:hypothetical protein
VLEPLAGYIVLAEHLLQEGAGFAAHGTSVRRKMTSGRVYTIGGGKASIRSARAPENRSCCASLTLLFVIIF